MPETLIGLVAALLSVVLGALFAGFGFWRSRTNREAVRRRVARKLPADTLKEFEDRLEKIGAEEGIEEWRYGYVLKKFDQLGDNEVEALIRIDIQRWFNLQIEIIELSNTIDLMGLKSYDKKDIVADFTKFFDAKDEAVFRRISPEMVGKLLSTIKTRREEFDAGNPPIRTFGVKNA